MNAIVTESKEALKALTKAPIIIFKKYEIWRRLVELHGTKVLHSFSGYSYEKLSGQRANQHSVRLNKQWRVIFSSDKTKKIEVIAVIKITAHDYRIK